MSSNHPAHISPKSRSSVETVASRALSKLKKGYLLINKQEIASWKGFLAIGVCSGLLISLMVYISSPQIAQWITSTLGGTQIINQAQVTYEDAQGKKFGPVSSQQTVTTLIGGETTPTPTPSVDTTPPGQVTDLAVIQLNDTTMKLVWTAPGDDGQVGTAASYDIRYGTEEINLNNFSRMIQPANMPKPKKAGQTENLVIADLNLSTTYYFALKTIDDAGNGSPLSNVALASTGGTPPQPDTTPPAAILSLNLISATNNSITFQWKSPGDDGAVGTASSYDIRYATTEIKDNNTFNSAQPTVNPPAPQLAGSKETYILNNLQSNIDYWVGIKTTDDAGNTSLLSHIIQATTNPIKMYTPQANHVSQILSQIQPTGKYKKNFTGIIVKIFNQQTKQEILELEGDSDDQGNLNLNPNNLPQGNYHMVVKTPLLLTKLTQNVGLTNKPQVAFTNIKVGNLQWNDDMINSGDYAIFSGKFGTSDQDADFNGDHYVNTLDFSILNANWAQVGEEVNL